MATPTELLETIAGRLDSLPDKIAAAVQGSQKEAKVAERKADQAFEKRMPSVVKSTEQFAKALTDFDDPVASITRRFLEWKHGKSQSPALPGAGAIPDRDTTTAGTSPSVAGPKTNLASPPIPSVAARKTALAAIPLPVGASSQGGDGSGELQKALTDLTQAVNELREAMRKTEKDDADEADAEPDDDGKGIWTVNRHGEQGHQFVANNGEQARTPLRPAQQVPSAMGKEE